MNYKLIPKVSKRQEEELRIIYAIMVAIKYGSLTTKDLFETGVSPEWLKQKDVGGRCPMLELADWMRKELWTKGVCKCGFLKVRKTPKGFVVSIDVCRLKQKRVKA